MRLTHFRVQNYKIIDDTGWVKVDENVTALVGKNESGKSAILKALWKARNVADAKFDKLWDFPRARYSTERTGTQELVALRYEFRDKDVDEKKQLTAQFPNHLGINPTRVELATSY